MKIEPRPQKKKIPSPGEAGNPLPAPEKEPNFGLTPQRKAYWLTVTVLVGFLLSLGWHYYIGVFHHAKYPLNTFLYQPEDRFNDFYKGVKFAPEVYTVPAPDRAIMPLPMVLFRIAALPFINSTLVLALWLGTFVAGSLWYMRRHLPFAEKGVNTLVAICLICFSYPFMFCVDRSNMECLIFVLLCAFVWCYGSGRMNWAALWLGVAMAMKPYTVVFGALFLTDRKLLLPGIKAAVLAGVLVFLSFLVLEGDFSTQWQTLKTSGMRYNEAYVVQNSGLLFSDSLYSLLKLLIATHSPSGLVGLDCRADTWTIHTPQLVHWFSFSSPDQIHELMRHIMPAYFIFALAAFGLVVLCLWAFRMEFWKQVALITCCMNLLPYVCGLYRLMHLFVSLALFIQTKKRSRLDVAYLVIYALLLIPKSYLHFAYAPIFQISNFEISEASYLDPLLMSALAALILGSTLRERAWSDNVKWLATRFGYGR